MDPRLLIKAGRVACMLHTLFVKTLKSIRSSCSQLAEGSELALQTKGQRCLEFVIRGGGNMAIICLHSSTPEFPRVPLQVIHQFDLGRGWLSSLRSLGT